MVISKGSIRTPEAGLRRQQPLGEEAAGRVHQKHPAWPQKGWLQGAAEQRMGRAALTSAEDEHASGCATPDREESARRAAGFGHQGTRDACARQ